MANDPSLKRKPSLDQTAGPNKRGRPPLDRNHYSRQQPQQQQQQQQQQTSNANRTSSAAAATNDEPSAFDRGYDAEKILGATDATVRRHRDFVPRSTGLRLVCSG